MLKDLAMHMPCLKFVTCRIAGGSVAIDVFDLLHFAMAEASRK